MENDFFEAEGEGSFAGGNKRVAFGWFGSGGFKAGREGRCLCGGSAVREDGKRKPGVGEKGEAARRASRPPKGRAALGGRRPPRRRHAAGPAGRPAAAPGGPADKSMAAGGAADAKKRGNPGENANQGLTRGSEVPIIFLCPSKGGGSAPFYPKGRRPLNAAGISPKKRREAP